MAVWARYDRGGNCRGLRHDGADLGRLALRHPEVTFILAHIGGGGDYRHTFAAVEDIPNVYLDLSGSGVDRGMLDDAIRAVSVERLLWGSDITMETGLAKLRALAAAGVTPEGIALIRWRNAARVFPPNTLPGPSAALVADIALSAEPR